MSLLALAERLAPLLESELRLVINTGEAAESLSSKLKNVQDGLQEAEREGVTSPNVKKWLKKLEDVAHEMEDVLDEWEMLNLQIELEGVSDDPSNFLANAHALIITLCSCSCFKPVLGRRRISKKVKALSDRMEQILSEQGRYIFGSGKNLSRGKEFKQKTSTSIVPSHNIYGREDVRRSLVKKLMPGGEEEGVRIVSITGIGGIGKTTLAQLAYNDVKEQGFFDLRGWVSVSEPFDASVVAKVILEQFGESSADAQSLETLVQRIKTCVHHKRFILVLDNVWTEDPNMWENLKDCLHGGAKGSRILVTTRDDSVAVMGTPLLEPRDPLSPSDCSEILNGIALGERGGRRRRRRNDEQLRLIGVEIARKCNGLPFAAMSLGSMLASKSTEEDWIAVLESPLWTHEETGERELNDIFRLLNLSYTDLSPVLKRCFLSSAIFPRGDVMSIDEMIRIWMAHGYLYSKSSDLSKFRQVRSKGLHYFNILKKKSFFVEVNADSFKMHDIMHEFATYILEDEDYSYTAHGGGAPCNRPQASLEKLRTFCETDLCHEANKLVLIKSVRVLSLRICSLQSLPEGVGKLVHLRYLDVSHNPIKELPKAVTNLYNLQTLGIAYCRELTSLPEGIEKLRRLRHILNRGTVGLYGYPRGLTKLSGLWTLSEFRARESNLGYLENLNQLQGSLTLYLWDFNDVEQARKSNLGDKKNIKELNLIFGWNQRLDVTFLEALQPPPNLQILLVHSVAGGDWLSHWIVRSFDKLKQLTFYGTSMCSHLPPFGILQALEKLVIYGCTFKCLKTEFLVGGFPKLKMLCFIRCFDWEEWEDIKEEDGAARVMRCLKELELHRCSGLKALPHSLLRQAGSLKTIKLSGTGMSRLQGGGMMRLPNVKWVVNDNDTSSLSYNRLMIYWFQEFNLLPSLLHGLKQNMNTLHGLLLLGHKFSDVVDGGVVGLEDLHRETTDNA